MIDSPASTAVGQAYTSSFDLCHDTSIEHVIFRFLNHVFLLDGFAVFHRVSSRYPRIIMNYRLHAQLGQPINFTFMVR